MSDGEDARRLCEFLLRFMSWDVQRGPVAKFTAAPSWAWSDFQVVEFFCIAEKRLQK